MEDPFELNGKAKEDHEKWTKSMDARIGRTDGGVKEKPFEKKARTLHEQARDFNKGVPVVDTVPKKKKADHNKRAKDYFTRAGYTYVRVDSYNPYGGVTNDFLGVFDALAFSPKNGIVGVQVTSFENRQARRTKILNSNGCRKWLEAGGKAVVLSYKRVGTHYYPDLLKIELKEFAK